MLNEIEVLCEVPIKVHVGEQEVEVVPPTLAKLTAAVPYWSKVIEKAMSVIKKTDKKADGKKATEMAVETMMKMIYDYVEDLLPVFKIYLAPRGKVDSEFTLVQLRDGLDIVDMRRILTFIRNGVNIGELIKNAVLPTLPTEIKEAGQK